MPGGVARTMIRQMPQQHPTTIAARRVSRTDALRLAASCGHVLIPPRPAEAGYRYVDLGADSTPFYLRRFGFGGRTAAIALRAPVERTAGDEAERGAPALAACELTVGVRRIAWDDLLTFGIEQGESAALAQRAMDALVELETVPPGECPLCVRR